MAGRLKSVRVRVCVCVCVYVCVGEASNRTIKMKLNIVEHQRQNHTEGEVMNSISKIRRFTESCWGEVRQCLWCQGQVYRGSHSEQLKM